MIERVESIGRPSWLRFSDADALLFCRFAIQHHELVPIVTCKRNGEDGKPIGPHIYEGFRVSSVAHDLVTGDATVSFFDPDQPGSFPLYFGREVGETTITHIEVLPQYFPWGDFVDWCARTGSPKPTVHREQYN